MVTDNSGSEDALQKRNISSTPRQKILFPDSSSSLCTRWLLYGSSAQWRAVNWHWLLHVSRTPIEPWLPRSLSAAAGAQRHCALKRLPQSMNTNGIDLHLHFLQGDLWTFIAEEEPGPGCVLNSLKWWRSTERLCSSVAGWAARSAAIMRLCCRPGCGSGAAQRWAAASDTCHYFSGVFSAAWTLHV